MAKKSKPDVVQNALRVVEQSIGSPLAQKPSPKPPQKKFVK